jgi:hypothetical protein
MRRVFSVLRISFIATAVVLGGLVITGLLGMSAYQQHLDDGLDSSYDTYSSMVALNDGLVVIYLLPLIAGFVALIVWTRKAFRVSETVAVTQFERKYSRGMAVGGWFIPIGNLFVPKRVISEIEQITAIGADPAKAGFSFKSQPLLAVGTWWWGLWVASRLVERAALSVASETDAEGFLTADAYYQSTSLSIAANIAAIASIVLGLMYLGTINRNAESIERINQAKVS